MRLMSLAVLAVVTNEYGVGCEGPVVPRSAPDAMVRDGGAAPGGPDASLDDAGFGDAGSDDAGSRDAGSDDAGSDDAGSRDAGSDDAGSRDAGFDDAGSPDGGAGGGSSGDAGSGDAGLRDAGRGDGGLSCPGGPTVFTTNMAARVVVGQPDFVSALPNAGGAGISGAGFNRPLGVMTWDGKLFVADGNNNRLLVYQQVPVANGAVADQVIGQPDLSTGDAGASATRLCDPQRFDFSATHLIVPEFCNRRVSFWPLSTLLGPTPAIEFVLGQPDLVTNGVNTGGLGPTTLAGLAAVRVVGARLLVADSSNHRVLFFEPVPGAAGASPTLVLGQPGFTTNASGTSLASLDFPLDVDSDGTSLVVVDASNDRAVLYDLPADAGAPASRVVGGWVMPATASSMQNPVGTLIADGRLFVADRANNRVLIWNTVPTSSNVPADVFLGQPGPSARLNNQGQPAPAANTLSNPHFLHWDGCRLYVSDLSNNRVLIY